jgi:hypothetical protein
MATKQQKPREAYVECQVLPGMFPGEYLAIFEAIDPSDSAKRITVRVLVDKENLEVDGMPERGKPVRGRLKVYIVAKRNGYVSAVLPQPGQPVGESIVVREDELAVA